MLAPDYPANEPERLAALRRLRLTQVPVEEAFERIVRVAKHAFRVPIAYLALIEEHRQLFKASLGLGVRDTDRGISFCGHAILKPEQTLIVPDAMKDSRFSDNPLVLGPPHFRFYAGRPFCSPDGLPLGTLCVADKGPRPFNQEDDQVLADLVQWVEMVVRERDLGDAQQSLIAELDAAQRESLLDPLLSIWNRRALNDLLARFQAQADETRQAFALALIDVDRFKVVNDTHGHAVGDEALHHLTKTLRQQMRGKDALGRWGGEEFLALFSGIDAGGAAAIGEKLRLAVQNHGLALANGQSLPLSVSIGIAVYLPGAGQTCAARLEAADQALYRAKQGGRNRVELAA